MPNLFSTSAEILAGCVMRELREPEPGVGGGSLLLAACTDGPLLLVQQARKSMSQPAECSELTHGRRKKSIVLADFRKSGIYSNPPVGI